MTSVAVHLSGQDLPSILLVLDEPIDGPPTREVYELGRGRVRIRADHLAPGAPHDQYVSLRISSGRLTFLPAPTALAGKLVIAAGEQCSLALAPDPRGAVPGGGLAGKDAANAGLGLPATISLTISSGAPGVVEVADAGWVLYGQPIQFAADPGIERRFEPRLGAVLIAMQPSAQAFEPGVAASPLIELAGSAPILRAGWVLPTDSIRATRLDADADAGSLAVQTDAGLSLGWQGLRSGPVRLSAPWVVLSPGFLRVTDDDASNLYANQVFELWQDADSPFRSELRLRFTDAFGLTYTANGSGTEILDTSADVDARLDRPVDVRASPLAIRARAANLILTHTDERRQVRLLRDNILLDSLDPAIGWPVQVGESTAIAIRNALFTTTPVNFLEFNLSTSDGVRAHAGDLRVALGLYGILPTLPDPYAANLGSPVQSGFRARRRHPGDRLDQTLNATVQWQTAPDDGRPDEVVSRFAFRALNDEAEIASFKAWGRAAQPRAVVVAPARQAAAAPQAPGPAGFAKQIWTRHFRDFDREQFLLLDVSSNADQMGVSVAWFDPRALTENDLIFFKVFGVQGDDDLPDFPLEIQDLDLSAQSRFVRAMTVPQLSCEPLANLTPPEKPGEDPPAGINLFADDGGPTRLFNNSVALVPIAPIPVMELLSKDFHERADGITGGLFTLPFGLHAFAEFSRVDALGKRPESAAALAFNAPQFAAGDLVGGLQLRVDAPDAAEPESATFKGSTIQFENVLNPDGSPTGTGTLGRAVGDIFNDEFFGTTGYKERGVPLTRIDLSGYGASIFSRWQSPGAAIAATSQVHFDVFVGRTANEVIQVRSLMYPWGVRVVRTIAIFRASSGYTYRHDSGWRAESDGIYDFSFKTYDLGHIPQAHPQLDPYVFHPGVVGGVFDVRNIRRTTDVPSLTEPWIRRIGEDYLDEDGVLRTVDAATPPELRNLRIDLQPVYFDADVEIDGVVSGARGQRVPSKGMLGYVQLAPRGRPVPVEAFVRLLQPASVGGPVDCLIDIGASGQLMRIGRVDISASLDAAARPLFVGAARGSVVLPKDGSWSVVQHAQGSGVVRPLDAQASVPLIRRGRTDPLRGLTNTGPDDLLRLADPAELVRLPGPGTRNYALLQSTGTQKALFRQPAFRVGSDVVHGAPPDFADAYRIVNSAGIFPNLRDAVPLALDSFQTRIVADGYRLADDADPARVLQQAMPTAPLYLINEKFLKLYVEYAGAKLDFGFDSSANDVGKKWLSKVNDISMVVDLGSLTRLMTIRGRFDAEKGSTPAFKQPELIFSEALQPVIDILQVLDQLQGGDYKGAFAKGLDVAMSNSADSWKYAFHARKEIPVVKFPPEPIFSTSAVDPLKLEAHLALGVYLNEALAVSGDPEQLIPSAGAFLEFGGSVSVLCLSLAGAAIYATGSVELVTAADSRSGPSLHMKFGFGCELIVGIPVVGGVSVTYMVGVQIDLDSGSIVVAGFLLYRGRAELLGGLLTIQIQIEAKGSVQRDEASKRTDLIAQVTFGVDISIFLVANISFSRSWQEARQIA